MNNVPYSIIATMELAKWTIGVNFSRFFYLKMEMHDSQLFYRTIENLVYHILLYHIIFVLRLINTLTYIIQKIGLKSFSLL